MPNNNKTRTRIENVLTIGQKEFLWAILNLVLAASFIALVFFLMPMMKNISDSRYPASTFAVSAEGKTTITPDLAEFSFSVVTEGADATVISDNNNRIMNGAIDFIKSKGINAKDIKTTRYNLNPKYEYDRNRNQSYIIGYELTQSVFVKVRDFDKLAGILGSLPELGVNQISSINFTVENQEQALSDARGQAFARAQEKARTIADQNNVRLGRLVNISEYQNQPYPVYKSAYDAYGLGGESLAVPPSIESGTEEITVMVNLTYEILE